MHIHPQLVGPTIAALIGLALVVAGTFRLYRAWPSLSTRRRWVLGGALGLFELLYWLAVYATFIEPRTLVVREVAVQSEHWRGAPLRIALIADTHVGGPHVDAARIEAVVARVNALHPDLVVLLGDYIAGHAPRDSRSDEEISEITRGLVAFARLSAPLGVVAVIGNHDFWYDRLDITRTLEEAGVAVLWNRNLVESRPVGGDFIVAGLEDDMTSHPDITRALDGAPDIDSIVLSHSPDPFPDMPDNVAIMLAAHTHCGQVTIPFIGRPVVPSRFKQRYACGLIEEDGKFMYVTGGVGTSMLPVRFLNPPEIVILTISNAGNTHLSPATH